MDHTFVNRELSLFSYEILGLVGPDGAGAHDLLRMARHGRILDWAGESQYYVEPKRLAKLGYLAARVEPGKTRQRTVYTLTDKGREALNAWARTAVRFTPVKSELLLRLLIADLVGETATRESISTIRDDISDLFVRLEESEGFARTRPSRTKYLLLVFGFLRRLLELHLEFVDDLERELAPRTEALSRPRVALGGARQRHGAFGDVPGQRGIPGVWHRFRARSSALDELVIGLDAAVLVQDEDLQAGACHLAAVGRDHLPVECDHVAEAVRVVPRPERVPPGCDEFVVGAGHPDLEFLVPAGLENKRGKAQPGRGLPHLEGRLEDVGAVLGPQVVDGLAAQLGVRLVPDRHVAADQVPGVDGSHEFSVSVGVSVSSPMVRAAPRPGNSLQGMASSPRER
jgi:DNA-binding PadR family transcriptional regulator